MSETGNPQPMDDDQDGFVKIEPEDEELEILVEGVDDIPVEKTPVEPPKPDQSMVILEGIKELVKQQQLRQEKPETVPEPPKLPELNSEELNATFMDDPVGGITKVLEHFVATKLAPGLSKVIPDVKSLGKKVEMMDKNNAAIMQRYGPEVEAIVAKSPNSPSAYEDAIKQVKFNHMNELIEEGQKINKEEIKKEILKELQPTTFYETTNRPSKKKQVIITQAVRDEAAMKGISVEDYIRYVKG
jgi:hypothetical protein